MPHSGSALSTSSNAFCDERYQNECWYSMARLNCFCASGLQDVSKLTLPNFWPFWASAGGAHQIVVSAVSEIAMNDRLMCRPPLWRLEVFDPRRGKNKERIRL